MLWQVDTVDAERGREGVVENKEGWASLWSRASQPVWEPAPRE